MVLRSKETNKTGEGLGTWGWVGKLLFPFYFLPATHVILTLYSVRPCILPPEKCQLPPPLSPQKTQLINIYLAIQSELHFFIAFI